MKKVTLTVVVTDETEANGLARQMSKSHLAQEGIFTLECGGIDDLTEDELDEVFSQVDEVLLSSYFVDKNMEDIEEDLEVDVDATDENVAFRGVVEGFRERYVLVRDQEDNVFCVLPKNIEVISE